MASAISSWLSGGNRRTAARAFSRSFVIPKEYTFRCQRGKTLWQAISIWQDIARRGVDGV
jgi:hypothetical protein